MHDYSVFPVLNAFLNGISAVLIATGIVLSRIERRGAHKGVMLGAVATSSLFLASYLYYHKHVGVVRFQGHGFPRFLYLVILASHTILAIVVVPLVMVTLVRAFGGKFDLHRLIARWTYPVWLYVSVTGVVIYLMLYRLFPR